MQRDNNNSQIRYDEYYRKSTDSEDRQVQSIEDQVRELKPVIARKGLKVVKRFEESMSAKRPGRSGFNELITRIESGEVNGIICWKINRLARNPIDGGKIQWLLQQGILKSIITPGKEYLPTDNVLMMAVELGVANQFSIDLSADVKRGMKTKAEKGWLPHPAPIGYLNDPTGLKGEKKVFKDPERFATMKKFWDTYLTGMYTVKQEVDMANNEWGLRTLATKKRPSRKLGLSNAYRILTNPFYTGMMRYKGEMKPAKHDAMITPEEFDVAQRILQRAGKPRPKYKRLPFNGIITCSQCGGMISADEKIKFIKSKKQVKRFLYHRCTRKKRDGQCKQPPVTYEELKRQITLYLDSITIPEEFLHYAIEVLRENNEVEEQTRSAILATHRKHYDECLKRIDNLIALYISPENIKREMLSDEEFKNQKSGLITEKAAIEAEIRKVESSVNEWLDLTEKTFKFATYAKAWFEKGDYEQKTHILQAIGENFVLTDGKLDIKLEKPFLTLKEGLTWEVLKKALCEPHVYTLDKRKNRALDPVYSAWSG